MSTLIRRSVCIVCVSMTLGALFTLWPGGSAEAMTRCGTEHLYYADPAKTQLIGSQIWQPYTCGCRLVEWGSISFYRTVNDYPYCF